MNSLYHFDDIVCFRLPSHIFPDGRTKKGKIINYDYIYKTFFISFVDYDGEEEVCMIREVEALIMRKII